MKLCVTGAAGYIGSVVAARLMEDGHDVTVIDNLSTGHRDAVPKGCRFVKGDVRDDKALERALSPDTGAVLHFAALSVVSESVARPLDYFENNVGGTIRLLGAMKRLGVKRLVFSSSAAVYGTPDKLPIEESAPCRPENPYGVSKLFVENALESCREAWGLQFVSLRYFNAGGSSATHGEHHDPESHLIPIILEVATGVRGRLTIFGSDYDTSDGTCIRDYIHVLDLAEAHILALDAMGKGFSGALNLGSDSPFTVLQVVKTAEGVTGNPIPYDFGPRRPGDPAALHASSRRAEQVLGWRKRCSSLEEIIRSAYEWRVRRPRGYAR